VAISRECGSHCMLNALVFNFTFEASYATEKITSLFWSDLKTPSSLASFKSRLVLPFWY